MSDNNIIKIDSEEVVKVNLNIIYKKEQSKDFKMIWYLKSGHAFKGYEEVDKTPTTKKVIKFIDSLFDKEEELGFREMNYQTLKFLEELSNKELEQIQFINDLIGEEFNSIEDVKKYLLFYNSEHSISGLENVEIQHLSKQD